MAFDVGGLQHVQTRAFFVGGLVGSAEATLDVSESQAVSEVSTRLRLNKLVVGGLFGRSLSPAAVRLSTASLRLEMSVHRAALVGGLAGSFSAPLQAENCKIILSGALGAGSEVFGLVGRAPAASSAVRAVVDDFVSIPGESGPALLAGDKISVQNVYLVSDRQAGGQYSARLESPRSREAYATFDFSWTWRVVTYAGVNATSESAFLQLSCPAGLVRVERQCVYAACIADPDDPVICDGDPAKICTEGGC